MKILMITPYAPYPPNSGGRIRMWEQIKYLGQRHELTVVFFVNSSKEHKQRVLLNDFCQQAIAVPHPQKPPANTELQDLLRMPNIVQWYNVAEMRQRLAALNAETRFNLAIIEHIFMAQYQPLCPTYSILQEHNIESNIFKQLAGINGADAIGSQLGFAKKQTFLKAVWMLMGRYENETWPNFPLRITVSDKDKQEMDRRCQVGKSVVIENGVDTKTITPVSNENARKILFMGTMNYEPNVDAILYFHHQILPKIWETNPLISLVIAGRDPTPTVQALAVDPRIEVIANPNDMSEVAQTCCMTVVPLRSGSGTRIKILHAMALGLPVVSTSIGCEGLAVTDGANILIRDEPEAFAEAVLRVVTNAQLRDQFRTAGRQLVDEQYDWSRKFEQLEKEMLELVEEKICYS